MSAAEVTIYSRPGCHLCDQAVDSVEALSEELGGLEIHQIDIESDRDLLQRYFEKIPVIEVNGVPVSELESDRDPLRGKLLAALRVGPARDGYAEGA